MYTAKPPAKVARIESALADYPDYDALDNLLYDWFCWECAEPGARGFMGQDKTCSRARSARQWQSTDELLAADVFAWQIQQVAAAIAELEPDAQLAIRIEARNRMGPSVWRNPRAGAGQAVAYARAKLQVEPLLRRRGVEY
ncbi:hypothetical protein [Cupriavidus malaysiensis]|uniref:Uncharacterized protein n=1 Tax=Cupriavidus malaysiensis TaxID=367825 RepID=A0ABM6F3F9_9BURK|nr:hypothetical protein [Cupriavidus malaysiensis]AOZ05952.1 hypothetical protein BKK80_09020 [Cupriavidus malaysiensis]